MTGSRCALLLRPPPPIVSRAEPPGPRAAKSPRPDFTRRLLGETKALALEPPNRASRHSPSSEPRLRADLTAGRRGNTRSCHPAPWSARPGTPTVRCGGAGGVGARVARVACVVGAAVSWVSQRSAQQRGGAGALRHGRKRAQGEGVCERNTPFQRERTSPRGAGARRTPGAAHVAPTHPPPPLRLVC